MAKSKYRSARKQRAATEAYDKILDGDEHKALKFEKKRSNKKDIRRIEIMESSSYKSVVFIQKAMDVYQLDPILGFFIPGVGDIFTKVFALPFVYVALVKIRSVPLTLAIIYNSMIDICAGLIPYVDIVLDVIVRSYKKNYRLITGFVNDDRETIQEVNRKAIWMAIGIFVFFFIIYYIITSVINMYVSTYNLILGLFN